MTVSYSIMVSRKESNGTSLIRLAQLARECNIHPELINRFVRLGLIDPAEVKDNSGEWLFTGETIYLVHKIVRLRNELGINFAGIGVVLDLLLRMEKLEARIRNMEKTEEKRRKR